MQLLQQLEVENEQKGELLPPSNLLIPGDPYTHPSKNVDHGGERRKRRKYKCSICHQYGHTAPTCPNKSSDSENDEEMKYNFCYDIIEEEFMLNLLYTRN